MGEKIRFIYQWLRDRRFAIVTKRQHIDHSLDEHGLLRIWWKYKLFDILTIVQLQDPMSFIVKDSNSCVLKDNKITRMN